MPRLRAWVHPTEASQFPLTAQLTIRDEGARQADLVFERRGSRWLRVLVAGRQVAEARFPPPDLRGRWGVGAPVGAAASWKSLRLR